MLEGVGPELGLAFWRMLRRTRLWAAAPPSERKGLAAPDPEGANARLVGACAHAPQLLETFGTFAVLVRDPGVVTAFQVAEACRRIQLWAEARSDLNVAALFAEAAAAADPDDPARAFDAGRLCRRSADYDRAGVWYLRAFGLAVRTKSREEVIKALLGYGNLMKDLGRCDEARVFYERAAQRAISTGRRRQAAEAHHALLALASEAGMYKWACRHVRKALDNYPVHHPLVPYLVADFTYVLLQNNHFGPALGLLGPLVSILRKPDEQAMVQAFAARAAGGVRNPERFREAEQSALRLLEHHQDFAPSALNCLAGGAWALGEPVQAEFYAAAALAFARSRNDWPATIVAEGLLSSLGDGTPPPVEIDPPDRDRLEALVRRLLSRLRTWEAAGGRLEPAASHVAVGPVTAAEAA